MYEETNRDNLRDRGSEGENSHRQKHIELKNCVYLSRLLSDHVQIFTVHPYSSKYCIQVRAEAQVSNLIIASGLHFFILWAKGAWYKI